MEKLLFALIALLTASGITFFFDDKPNVEFKMETEPELYKVYTKWKSDYHQNFNSRDDSYRFEVFSENYEFIQRHNALNDGLTLGLNQFTALTNQEFKELIAVDLLQTDDEFEYAEFDEAFVAADKIDWRHKDAVTPIRNQGKCGSCWAFSTTGSLEGLRAIQTGKLEWLSPQQLVSCLKPPFGMGCNGGNQKFGFIYTSRTGVTTETEYPYVQADNPKTTACTFDPQSIVFKNKSLKPVKPNSPDQMIQALNSQPISISVEADSIFFQTYKEGILKSDKCGIKLNHAIMIVGYDQTDPNDSFWIARNSWGSQWGMEGYAKIAISSGNGVCGINMDPSYPT